MDIVAVLDRSGSMSGEKMQMLHTTVGMMIDHLSENDRLSLVAYDDRVEDVTPLTKMDKAGKAASRAALAKINDRGSTNLHEGLIRGLQVLKDRVTDKNEISSVLLLTDGLANVGVTEPSAIVASTQQFLASMNNPTSVYCFGFGGDHNSQLLTAIANEAHGMYYFMKTPDSVPPAFADCLGGLMSVVAQNIRLTVTAAEGVVINAVTTAFAKTEDVPQRAFTVSVGDLFSEEERDILVDLAVPAAAAPTDAFPLLHCSLKYTNVITAATATADLTVTLVRTADGVAVGQGSVKVDQQRNRIQTAQALEQARQMGERGQLKEARDLLQATHQRIAATPSVAMCGDLMQDLQSVEGHMADQRMFQAEGAHRAMNKSHKHYMQRACESDDTHVQSYSNPAKAAMRSMFK